MKKKIIKILVIILILQSFFNLIDFKFDYKRVFASDILMEQEDTDKLENYVYETNEEETDSRTEEQAIENLRAAPTPIPGNEFVDKGLIIMEGVKNYTMQVNTSNTITWSSENTSIATINSNNRRLNAVSPGSTNILATLNGVTYKIPVTVVPKIATNNSYRQVDILIDSDDETTTYYNFYFQGEFIEAYNGTRIYVRSLRTARPFNLYMKPDSGYALSYISKWFAPVVTETEGEVRAGGGPYIYSTTESSYSATQKADEVATAYSRGAEGMYGFVVSGSNVTETLTVRSEKLPSISETVYSINGNLYQQGDKASPGDTVIFKVDIDKELYEYVINYEGALQNSLSGAVFIGTTPTGTGNSTTQSITMNTTSAVTQTYYIKYVVPANATGTITNQVTFNYESYPDPSNTNVNGKVDSTASYRTDRTDNASATVDIRVPTQTTDIEISNTVTGNMRETNKYFKFLVAINGTNGDQYTISGQDSQVTYEGISVNTSSTYTVGNTNYVYLKDGQTVTIGLASNGTTKEIPVGTTYTITEQDAEDYSTTISGVQGVTKTTGTLTLIDGTNQVGYTNSRDRAAMTGVFLNNSIYLALLIISILIILKMFINNIKKDK